MIPMMSICLREMKLLCLNQVLKPTVYRVFSHQRLVKRYGVWLFFGVDHQCQEGRSYPMLMEQVVRGEP